MQTKLPTIDDEMQEAATMNVDADLPEENVLPELPLGESIVAAIANEPKALAQLVLALSLNPEFKSLITNSLINAFDFFSKKMTVASTDFDSHYEIKVIDEPPASGMYYEILRDKESGKGIIRVNDGDGNQEVFTDDSLHNSPVCAPLMKLLTDEETRLSELGASADDICIRCIFTNRKLANSISAEE